jgi:aspartate-semialdehyde dehydrogenase
VRVGFVGWRGMVGSVLLERMREEKDFTVVEPVFFSTSEVGGTGPDVGHGTAPLQDAYSLDALAALPVILSAQGGDYTKSVYRRLRQQGWNGYWVDAASTLRMEDEAVLVLDPVNLPVIEQGLARGLKTYCGANCTVSVLLMGLDGLLRSGQVEWISTMTYQAASGAGANGMRELVAQVAALGNAARSVLEDPAAGVLELDRRVSDTLRDDAFPHDQFGAPLAGSLLPWIDSAMPGGATREEWKADVEANKMLGANPRVPIDGICVRVGSMRCHAHAFLVHLRQEVPLADIEAQLAAANPWADVVPNTRETTLARLTPASVAGTLRVPVGRLRKTVLGERFLAGFTVGDQLLWGAAEPLRRMLRILHEHGVQ